MLIFTRTRHGANRLVKKMVHSGIAAAAIHSDKHSEFAPALWRISRPTKSVLGSHGHRFARVLTSSTCRMSLITSCLIFPMIIFTALGAPVAPALRGKQSLWLAPAKSGFCRELKPSSVKRWFVKLRRALSRLTMCR